MLPRFEITARHRPMAIVGSSFTSETCDSATTSGTAATPHLAPYAAIEVALRPGDGTTALSLAGADGSSLGVRLADGVVSLAVTVGGSVSRHRSRRHGRVRAVPTGFALTLTGTHLTALVLEADAWVARGRVDLTGVLDTRDQAWLAGLTSSWVSTSSSDGGGTSTVTGWSAGTFGQLGLRDIRLATHADGTPYREEGAVFFAATSAGPGFFDTAHTSVWRLDEAGLAHTGDLYFERSDRPGSFGDHATHLVRDGNRWLVATSTWGDFRGAKAEHPNATVGITLAETTADLTRGQHLLATRPLALPTSGPSVGTWDPHLVRTDSGDWLVAYVSARKFFDFHPVLASGLSLDDLALRAAATDRRATEGTTIVRLDDAWRVLASDGRDNPRATRGRFPVFDLELHEVGTLDAPYPSNIPWPTVIAPDEYRPDDRWSLVTFDGTPAGGRLAGYGTHGDVVVMRASR